MINKRGFSLVELAVVLVITGVIASVAIKMTAVSTRTDCYALTKTQLGTINEAFERYARKNGRLPFPANRYLGVKDKMFGREDSDALDPTHTVLGSDYNATVSRGALPFQELGLPTSFAADCWDNKFTYIVTTDYTNKTGFNDHTKKGTLIVKNPGTAAPANGDVAYAVISHGADGLGAVKRNDTSGSWCNVAPASADSKTINCQVTNNGQVYVGPFNDGSTGSGNFFDDVVVYHGRLFQPDPCPTNKQLSWDDPSAPGVMNCIGTTGNFPLTGTFPVENNGSITWSNAQFGANPSYYVGAATFKCDDGTLKLNDPTNTRRCIHVQDGGWSPWTNWQYVGIVPPHTVAQEKRTRSCNTPPPSATTPPGEMCVRLDGTPAPLVGGVGYEEQFEDAAAPVPGGWGPFTPWTPVVGDPTQEEKHRNCDTPTPANGGALCTKQDGTLGTYEQLFRPAGNCSGTVTWGASNQCSGDIGTITNGSNASVTNTAANATGTVTVTCSSGTPVLSNPVCTSQNCAADSNVGWSGSGVGGAACSGAVPTLNNGDSFAAVDCEATVMGHATIQCLNGVLTPDNSTATCTYVGCFLPDVHITMADGSSKKIAELTVGDRVKGHTRINTVLSVPNFDTVQPAYSFNGGEKFVTGGHPFWTAKGWKAIVPALTPTEGHNVKTTTLKVGDQLLLDDGKPFTVTSIEHDETGTHHVYNPTVDGDHTYYANGLLVHNKFGPSCTPGSCPATTGTTVDGQSYTVPAAASGEEYCVHSYDDTRNPLAYATDERIHYSCQIATWNQDSPAIATDTCFVGDATITLADGSQKPFAALKAGDRVKGHTRINTITAVPSLETTGPIYSINDSAPFVTGGHPFYTATGWKAIDPRLTPTEHHNVKTTKLLIGDVLTLDDGSTLTVDTITAHVQGNVRVYNPMLDGDHTYYANHLLVHNKTPLGTTKNISVTPGPCSTTPAFGAVNGVCGPGSNGDTTIAGDCSAGTMGNGLSYIGPSGSSNAKMGKEWDCVGLGTGTTAHCHTQITYGCFLAETAITLADGTVKPVSALHVGDKVKGHTRINTVVKLPTFTSEQRVYGLNGGKKFVTGGHPLYSTAGWKAIDPSLTPTEGHNVKTTRLKVGDVMLLDSGKTVTVTSIDGEASGEHMLFNPILDGDHTYFANGVLVHNKDTDPPEPPIPFGPSLPPCPAGPISWGPGNACSGTMPTIVSGDTDTVTDTNNPLNTATINCSNGTATIGSPSVCNVPNSTPCTGTVSWTVGTNHCSADIGTIADGGHTTGLTNTATSVIGTADVACAAGVKTVSNPLCTASATQTCQAKGYGLPNSNVVYPSPPSAAQIAQYPAVSSGIVKDPIYGTYIFDVNGPAWTSQYGTGFQVSVYRNPFSGDYLSTYYCGSLPGQCTGTVSWGAGNACSADIGTMSYGASNNITNTAAGKTGSATVLCNSNGTTTVSNPVCTASSFGTWQNMGGNNCGGLIPCSNIGATYGQSCATIGQRCAITCMAAVGLVLECL